jgi:hypothetical protein
MSPMRDDTKQASRFGRTNCARLITAQSTQAPAARDATRVRISDTKASLLSPLLFKQNCVRTACGAAADHRGGSKRCTLFSFTRPSSTLRSI